MTKEILEEVKKASSCDELMAAADKKGIKLERQKAEEIFSRFNKCGEIGDDELDNVAGGGSCEDAAQKALGM